MLTAGRAPRFLPLLALTLSGCVVTEDRAPNFAQFEQALTGTFSSSAQAAVSPDYFAVRLVGWPIWTDRADGPWLYIEQALESSADRPYRQRVYRLRALREPGTWKYQSDVYLIPEPARFIASWRQPEVFDTITPDDLELRTGCTVTLTRTPDGFQGTTAGDGCPSSRGGAAYATSEVTITADQVLSWDRGFDADGNQVWGAEQGPYIFDRVSEGPPPAP